MALNCPMVAAVEPERIVCQRQKMPIDLKSNYGRPENKFQVRIHSTTDNMFVLFEIQFSGFFADLKVERRKLKTEKIDLLAHVKQLCASLQDKEQELRDFIRNFEHRMRETETSSVKMSTDRERERFSLLKHAREEAERSIALATQLNTRDMQLKRAQEQLREVRTATADEFNPKVMLNLLYQFQARRQLSGCMSDQESLMSYAPLTPPSNHHLGGGNVGGYLAPGTTSSMIGMLPGDRGSCSADSGVRGSSDRESAAGDMNLSDGACDNGPCITIDSDSISLVSSQYMNQCESTSFGFRWEQLV